MAQIKLKKKIIYSGTIELLTGLHIGGTNSTFNIGGPDNFIVRNPLTNIPYIPGSSLKGKLRALIEIAYGETNNGEATNNPNSKAGRLFGVSPSNKDSSGRPSRLIVRDADLDDKASDFSHTDLPFSETKTEVTINRITAKANPRTFERVPASAKFNFNMVLNVFENENEEELVKTLKEAIQLLENDYLGGNGSRGYGQVKFEYGEKTINY